MPITVTTLVAQLKQLQAYLKKHPDALPELRRSADELTARFRSSFTPDELREAINDDAEVDSELEEQITSALLMMRNDRTRRGAQ